MTKEKANEIFKTEIGIQLDVIYVTSDDKVFIRLNEALLHTNDMLNGDPENFVDTTITEWYNENHKTNIPRTTQQIIDEDFSGGLDMGQVTPKEEPKQLAVEWLEIELKKVMIDNQIQQTLHLFEQAKQMEEEQRGYSEEHLIKVVEKFHSLQLNEFKSFLELLEFKKEEE
jgi:hypothetical protein